MCILEPQYLKEFKYDRNQRIEGQAWAGLGCWGTQLRKPAYRAYQETQEKQILVLGYEVFFPFCTPEEHPPMALRPPTASLATKPTTK